MVTRILSDPGSITVLDGDGVRSVGWITAGIEHMTPRDQHQRIKLLRCWEASKRPDRGEVLRWISSIDGIR